MSNQVKVVMIYGEPIMVEANGLLFRRNMEGEVIIGEQTNREGMATTLIEVELSENDVIAALYEAGFGDFMRGAGVLAKNAVSGIAGKAADAVRGAANFAKSTVANAAASADAVKAIGAGSNVSDEIKAAVQALGKALASLENFSKYAATVDPAKNPRLAKAVSDVTAQVASLGIKVMKGGMKIKSGTWQVLAKPDDPAALDGIISAPGVKSTLKPVVPPPVVP